MDDALDVGAEALAIGVIERAGDRIGDVMRMVTAIAVGEHERSGEVELAVSSAGVVAQEESSADGLEAEIGASSGVAAPGGWLLHITKISKRQRPATHEFSSINTMWSSLLKT